MNGYNFSVSYQTKIIDVKSVNLVGELNFNLGGHDEDGYYEIVESGGNRRNLEEWLDKFQGRRVRIFIEALEGKDEAKLLEGEQEPAEA